jgi:acyl carrier protein
LDIEEELRTIIRKKATKATLASDTKLTDLGLDSLDLVEIVFEIEDKFRIHLPQDDKMSEAQFSDLVQLVQREIANSASGTTAPSAAT